MWSIKKKIPFLPIFIPPFQGAERKLSGPLKASFEWSNQKPYWGLCRWDWIFAYTFTHHTACKHTKEGWEKQLSNPSSSGNLSANILFRSGSLARPIKTLTLHNTHIRMEASVEFSPICGELFCVVQCVLKHFTDRRPSAKVPVAHKYKTKVCPHLLWN